MTPFYFKATATIFAVLLIADGGVLSVSSSNNSIGIGNSAMVVDDVNITTTTDSTAIDDKEEENSGWVTCSLCQHPAYVPNDPTAVFDAGDSVITCADAHSLGYISLPQENCTFFQSWGTSLCQCGVLQQNTEPNYICRLCQDGTLLPNGRQQGFPGVTCAELQVRATRDNPSMCPAWQATVGEYCGCSHGMESSSICRLCGGEEHRLPYPLRFISGSEKSCTELELDANHPEANCEEFQLDYGADCCYTPPPETITHGTSSGTKLHPGSPADMRSLLVALVVLWTIL